MNAKTKTTVTKYKLTTKKTKSLQSTSITKVIVRDAYQKLPSTNYSTEFKENLMAQF